MDSYGWLKDAFPRYMRSGAAKNELRLHDEVLTRQGAFCNMSTTDYRQLCRTFPSWLLLLDYVVVQMCYCHQMSMEV